MIPVSPPTDSGAPAEKSSDGKGKGKKKEEKKGKGKGEKGESRWVVKDSKDGAADDTPAKADGPTEKVSHFSSSVVSGRAVAMDRFSWPSRVNVD